MTGHVLGNTSLPSIPLWQALQGPVRLLEDPLVPADALARDVLTQKDEARLIQEYLAALGLSLCLDVGPEAAVIEINVLRRDSSDLTESSAGLDQEA